MIPHAGVGIGGLQRVIVEAGNPLHVRQRRHVHDRHARHLRGRHGIEQFADAGRAVLRLLHGEPDEVVILGIDAGRAPGRHLARQLARIDLDRLLAAADRKTDTKPLGIDQVGLGGKADEMDRVSAEQDLGRQQRPVGGPHDQYFVFCRHNPLLRVVGGITKTSTPGLFSVAACYAARQVSSIDHRRDDPVICGPAVKRAEPRRLFATVGANVVGRPDQRGLLGALAAVNRRT